MELNVDKNRLKNSQVVQLIDALIAKETDLGLESAKLYYEFPILKNYENDTTMIAELLILSPKHGLCIIGTSGVTGREDIAIKLGISSASTNELLSNLFSRLIRNKHLRKGTFNLVVPAYSMLYAPLVPNIPESLTSEVEIVIRNDQLINFFKEIRSDSITDEVFSELVSTVEGAKGICRPKERILDGTVENSKGSLANKIETEITSFDLRQKHGSQSVLDGFQRIRGLAGSGKTVVLAMKAALTHLRDDKAKIVYTYYTKALYQHIKQLITRFYRQFEDKDPDWSKVKIMHGWGGYSAEGVYFNACKFNDIPPINYKEASRRSKDPFGYACENLMQSSQIKACYDYIFIDEGQDFPPSFIKLCLNLSKDNRVVFAYDDLQTIFQPTAPAISEIVGKDPEGRALINLNEDVILAKCYRNPREILVCAHSLGLGIYGKIVQMLESKNQWQDIGYNVIQGDFSEGSQTIVERPEKNSLTAISSNQLPGDIIKCFSFKDVKAEIEYVVTDVIQSLQEGLRPEDILVTCVDDRNAKLYLRSILKSLAEKQIDSNNIHEDTYGLIDFQKEGKVTLSTVHKAKGNEAFLVYVVGVDALYGPFAGPRERNALFTAMTRAKGWVRVTGLGDNANLCKNEIDTALANFPCLKFNFPGQEQIKIIREELIAAAKELPYDERNLNELLSKYGPEQLKLIIEQKVKEKNKKK